MRVRTHITQATSMKLAAPVPTAGEIKDFTAAVAPGMSEVESKAESKVQDQVAQSTVSAMASESVQAETVQLQETVFEPETDARAVAALGGEPALGLEGWQRVGAAESAQAAFAEAFRPARGLRRGSPEPAQGGADALAQELSALRFDRHLSAMGRAAQRLR